METRLHRLRHGQDAAVLRELAAMPRRPGRITVERARCHILARPGLTAQPKVTMFLSPNSALNYCNLWGDPTSVLNEQLTCGFAPTVAVL